MDLSTTNPGYTTLTWTEYHPHLSNVFARLQLHSSLVDVSLTCASGQTLRCHKVLLAAASPYFQQLFSENGSKHPVVILPHVEFPELQDIVEYVYRGEVSLSHSRLQAFLSASRSLQLEGIDQFVKREIKEEEEEKLRLTPSSFLENESILPQDLSMKSLSPANKRRRLEEASHPNLAHDTKPECVYSSDPRHTNSFTQHLLSSSLAQAILLNTAPTTDQVIKAQLGQDKIPEQRKSKEMKELKQEGSKVPPWSQSQLQEAIESVITQKLRFTQASAKYGIPKGTLYDNILGKSKRMLVLEQVGLTETQEMSVLEFCCEISTMPYNRRTSRSLRDIREFIANLKSKEGKPDFQMSMRQGFKWWWAFTKKHSIISLYYESQEQDPSSSTSSSTSSSIVSKTDKLPKRQSLTPPGNLLNLVNDPSSTHITIPTSPLPLFPFLGLNGNSKYSKIYSDFGPPPLAHSNVT